MMFKQKLTKRKVKSLIKDEAMAVKEYTGLGFKNLAKDEAKHKAFLKKLSKCKSHSD
jgi:hypothetical protein